MNFFRFHSGFGILYSQNAENPEKVFENAITFFWLFLKLCLILCGIFSSFELYE